MPQTSQLVLSDDGMSIEAIALRKCETFGVFEKKKGVHENFQSECIVHDVA